MIESGSKDDAPITFFLRFLTRLQKLGTIPGTDISKYSKALEIIDLKASGSE